MGPPGVGKGTQAVGIAAHYQIPAISTGDIFRANVKNATELGKEVSRIMAEGGYVPDEITNAIVADRLTEADAANGWLLDGYRGPPARWTRSTLSWRRPGRRSTPSSRSSRTPTCWWTGC